MRLHILEARITEAEAREEATTLKMHASESTHKEALEASQTKVDSLSDLLTEQQATLASTKAELASEQMLHVKSQAALEQLQIELQAQIAAVAASKLDQADQEVCPRYNPHALGSSLECTVGLLHN